MGHVIESLGHALPMPVTSSHHEETHLGPRVRRALPLISEFASARGIPAGEKFSMCNRCGEIVPYLATNLPAHQRQCVCGSTSWEIIDAEQRAALIELNASDAE